LYKTDIRANIIERPSTSQNAAVFNALMLRFAESFATDKRLFERKVFRALMKELNLYGGVKLLALEPSAAIDRIIDQFLEMPVVSGASS
jgi:hypothetical protein